MLSAWPATSAARGHDRIVLPPVFFALPRGTVLDPNLSAGGGVGGVDQSCCTRCCHRSGGCSCRLSEFALSRWLAVRRAVTLVRRAADTSGGRWINLHPRENRK